MGYVSPRAFACLAEDKDDPLTVDCGIAPLVEQELSGCSRRHRPARLARGPDHRLVRLPLPGLPGCSPTSPTTRNTSSTQYPTISPRRLPARAAAAGYAEQWCCQETTQTPGATFNINTPNGGEHSMALLWARDDGYWKIVREGGTGGRRRFAVRDASPVVRPVRFKADDTLVAAARDFLQSRLLRRD